MDSSKDSPDVRKGCPAVRVVMFPKDTNGTATNIFGGVILSHMDVAGAIAARRMTSKRVVTVSFDKVVFKKPVHVGDVLTLWSEVIATGVSSITTRIIVEAERRGHFIAVTEGEAVYVAVDQNDRPVPFKDEDVAAHAQPANGCDACCSSQSHAWPSRRDKKRRKNQRSKARKNKSKKN